jgi:hypothetical protein
MQTREETYTEVSPAEEAARPAAHEIEHVERNANAAIAYLFRPQR